MESLAHQQIPKSAFEILAVNNDPSDPIPADFVLPENATLLSESRKGSYAARNLAIAHAKGDIIAFTDSDCKPQLDWLAQGLDIMVQGFDMAGGAVTFFKEHPDDSDLVFSYERNFSFNQKRNVEVEKCSITANLFVRKEIFAQLGWFREDIFSGADTVWTKNATANGASIAFAEDAVVHHPSRKSIAELYSKKRRTTGGYYNLYFESKSWMKKAMTLLMLLRPPITIFIKINESFLMKVKLFFTKWSIEFVGAWELLGLSFDTNTPKRS